MNIKNKKAAFLGFLIACAGAYTASVSHDDDPRATEFAQYISDDINALVARHLTADEIQQYVESYRKNPGVYNVWLNNLIEDSKALDRGLMKNANVIHNLDSVAGRKLAFSEALRRIEELPDTSANPNKAVVLQRQIKAKKDVDVNIALSRAAIKRVKPGK